LVSTARPSDVLRRVGGQLQRTISPASRLALLDPAVFSPPAPRAFASFGENSWIVPPARIRGARHLEIGSGVVVMENVDIRADAPIHLGDGCRFARFATLWASVGIHIGNEVLTSDYVSIIDCWCPPDSDHRGPDPAPVVIEDGAYLGCGCVIGPGVRVGRGAFVGEGAVVFDDVPAHAVVYGNPARPTRRWTEAAGWQGDMFGHPS
jgi:acetyltransferase-like isoleucine patch superfamily enzyme